MSDGTSCETFSLLYKLLADETRTHKNIAREMWKHSSQLDFWMSDMEADVALSKLGLAEACSRCGGFIYKDYEDHHDCREE